MNSRVKLARKANEVIRVRLFGMALKWISYFFRSFDRSQRNILGWKRRTGTQCWIIFGQIHTRPTRT